LNFVLTQKHLTTQGKIDFERNFPKEFNRKMVFRKEKIRF